MSAMLKVMKIKCGSWLACESGRAVTDSVTDTLPSPASRIASLHPQHNLADMIPTFHPRMGLGGVGIGVDLVDHRQATPGTE